MSEPETHMSATQMRIVARDIMKKHPLMDGSGHLYLKGPAKKLTRDQQRKVRDFVFEGLKRQGIAVDEGKFDGWIVSTLHSIAKRGSAPEPNREGLRDFY